VPLLALDLGVFVLPMGYLLRLSVAERTTRGAFVEGSWSLSGYRYVAETPLVHEIVGFALLFGVLVTALAVAVAVVYAYATWRAVGRVRTVLVSGAVLSLFTALVAKLFAVVLVFAPRGVLTEALLGVGVLSEPLLLVDNLTGAVLGQLYIVVPYAILAVYAVLSGPSTRTVPVEAWSSLRQSLDPLVSVVSTLLVVAVVALVLVAKTMTSLERLARDT